MDRERGIDKIPKRKRGKRREIEISKSTLFITQPMLSNQYDQVHIYYDGK